MPAPHSYKNWCGGGTCSLVAVWVSAFLTVQRHPVRVSDDSRFGVNVSVYVVCLYQRVQTLASVTLTVKGGLI